MKGAVLYGPGDIRFEDREDPTIDEPTDAILRLAATCVCVAAEYIDFRDTSWVIHNAISPRQIRKSRSLSNLRGK